LDSKKRKLNTGSFVLFLVAMALLIVISVSSLYSGFTLYANNEEGYVMYLVTGFFGLILVAYGANQMKNRIIVIQPIEFNVMTTTECKKCGFRDVRTFEVGDYVVKTGGSCPKCNDGKMLITAIYHEDKQTKPSFF